MVYKTRWREHRGGGLERVYEPDDIGDSKLRLVTEEEVKPSTKYYLVDPSRPNVFYETHFAPEVSWESILEFIQTKKIYTKDERPNQNRPRKPPNDRDNGAMQSSLF